MEMVEMVRILIILRQAFPREPAFDGSPEEMRETAAFWTSMAQGISYEAGKQAAEELCRKNVYAPKLADFLAAAERITGGHSPGAWELAAVRQSRAILDKLKQETGTVGMTARDMLARMAAEREALEAESEAV